MQKTVQLLCGVHVKESLWGVSEMLDVRERLSFSPVRMRPPVGEAGAEIAAEIHRVI